MTTDPRDFPNHVTLADLTPEHIGQPIRYDLDEPTTYGGHRPHPDGDDPDHVILTLDGRDLDAWLFDDVWIP